MRHGIKGTNLWLDHAWTNSITADHPTEAAARCKLDGVVSRFGTLTRFYVSGAARLHRSFA